MRGLLGFAAGCLAVLAGCQAAPEGNNSEVRQLAPLTLAEVHREGPRSYRRCNQVSGSAWRCEKTSDYVITVVPAPVDVAPFMAQIYLHPDFTTEEDLVAQGAQGLPMWSVRHICGGALVAPNWVATAAHCFPDPRLDTKYGVRIGLSDIVDESGTLFRVEEVVRRDPDAPTRENDIALVRFSLGDDQPAAMSQSMFTRFAGFAPPVTAAITGLRDQVLLALDGAGWLQVIDLRNGTRTQSAPYSGGIDLLPEENLILSWGPQQISLTPIDAGSEALSIPFAQVSSVLRTADRRVIVGHAFESGEIRTLSPETGQTIASALVPARAGQLYLVAQDRRVLVTTFGRTGYLFDIETGERVPLDIPESADFVGVFDQTERLVFQDPGSGELYLVEAETGRLLDKRTTPRAAFGRGVESDRYLIAWEGANAPLFVYDGSSLEALAMLAVGSGDGVRFWEWSQDGARLILESQDERSYAVYDLATRTFTQSVTFSADERIARIDQTSADDALLVNTRLSTGISAEGFPLSDLVTYIVKGQTRPIPLRRLTDAQLNQGAVANLTWTTLPSGAIVGTALSEGRSFVWDPSSCSVPDEVCRPSGELDHSVPVASVQYVEGLSDLIVLAENGTVQLWDPLTGTERLRVFHGGQPLGATWDASSNRLLTYGENGFLRAWDITTGAEVQRVDFAAFADRDSNNGVDQIAPVAPDREATQPQTTYLRLDDGEPALTDGTPVRVFGWGRYNVGNTARRSQVLREAGLQVLSPASCRAPEYWDGHNDIHDRVFCAQDKDRKTCVGDSGGPVVLGTDLASLKLVGVASWGSQACEADGKPGVYTRIASHAEWIMSVIGPDLPPEPELAAR